MKRRVFLKATLATAGTLMVGCGDDGGNPGGDTGDTGGDTGSDASEETGGESGDAVVLEPGAQWFPQSVASGDPTAASVILWTRVWDGANPDQDLQLELQVATDAEFTQRVVLDGGEGLALTASPDHDYCVKVRLSALEAGTLYWYRFVYVADDGVSYASRTGRTRTAAAADAEVPVKFAVVSCQDYGARYYNAYRRLALEEDLEFFVHLGDYIYETAGDPLFQRGEGAREIIFDDTEGALQLGEGDGVFYAASSLSNYRQLYKTFRSDPHLQRAHELFPMIAVPDDHEFSDDCFGQTATYHDGAEDEWQPERRRHADQAWYEFMPVDFMDEPDFVYDPSVQFPGDMTVYRDFRFGAHVHLVMTDLRRYRADHLIPEDAWPGRVAVTEQQLLDALGAVPEGARPYIDIDAYDGGSYKALLTDHAADLGLDVAELTGLVSADWINGLAEGLEALGAAPAQIDDPGLAVGFAYHHAFKSNHYSSLGSRYLVVDGAFRAIAAVRWAESGGASELCLGDAQRAWFLDAIQASTATWKVWGNEYMLMGKSVDLSQAASLPESFQVKFRLSVEDWDGLPNRRDELITVLAAAGNVVAVTGDIHAFFAGTPWVAGDPATKIVELVTGAISSATYRDLLFNQATSDPDLVAAGAPGLAIGIEQLMADPNTKPNPHLGYLSTHAHGFMTCEVDAEHFDATFYMVPAAEVATQFDGDDDALVELFATDKFRVASGSPELHHQGEDGTWLVWDPDALAWGDVDGG